MEQTIDYRQALNAIASALVGVVDQPGWKLSEDDVCELTLTALKVREGVEELTARLVGEVESRKIPQHDGATGTAAWLQARGRLSAGAAGRAVAHARAIATALTPVGGTGADTDSDGAGGGVPLAATRRAWAAGAVTADHVMVIARAIHGLGDDVSAEDHLLAEKVILDEALVLGVDGTRHVANHVFEHLDPDGADARLSEQLRRQEQQALGKTRLSIRRRGDGTTTLHGLLPDLHGDILRTALEGLSSPRRVGTEKDPAKRLPYEQRMGLAFCELIEHLPTDKLPQSGGVPATITINLDLKQLMSDLGVAMLSTGTEISASQARRLACNAGLIPIVLNGTSRILDMGTEQRLYDRYQRIALAHRDKGCCMRGCDRPAAWCESHHLDPNSHGGPTTIANGALFCWYHHVLIHTPGWQARLAPDGIVEVIPPPHIDPQQKPLRHERFQRKRE